MNEGGKALAGLYYTSQNLKVAQTSADEARNAATQSRELTRQGQITDRFTKAIDQLGETGKDKTSVRLGGPTGSFRAIQRSPIAPRTRSRPVQLIQIVSLR